MLSAYATQALSVLSRFRLSGEARRYEVPLSSNIASYFVQGGANEIVWRLDACDDGSRSVIIDASFVDLSTKPTDGIAQFGM